MSFSVVIGLIVAAAVVAGGVYTLVKKSTKAPAAPPSPPSPPSTGGGGFKI